MLTSGRNRMRAKLRGQPSIEELRARGLRLGANVWLGDRIYFDPAFPWLIEIGDDVAMALGVVILAHDAAPRVGLGYTRIGRVTVESGVRIGHSALILPGVTVGQGAIVRAFSVVTRDVPPETVVAGNPAKVISSLPDYLREEREAMDVRPVWPAEGWTVRGAITQENARAQREALMTGDGYVQ